MINLEQVQTLIISGLQNWLTSEGYSCPVIFSNQTAPTPPYPYVSCTVTTPHGADNKGYSIADDGSMYKPFTQIWSFTIQSDNDLQSQLIALTAHDWFEIVGNLYLSDNNIVVQSVGNITNRDNLISIEYEYRNGFDVTFSLVNILSGTDVDTGSIEEFNPTRTN